MALIDKKPPVQVDFNKDAGPLRPYLTDPEVSEIMVNRWDRIFVEKRGVVYELEHGFENAEALVRFAQAAAIAAGRELNRRFPCVDSRLPDGSRISLIGHPVALDGPIVTIRRHRARSLTHEDMVKAGSVDDKLILFLYQLVRCRQNLVVCGGTSSGKTTLLNVLSSFILPQERIITIEDTAELNLQVRNLVRMETKPEIGQDTGVSARDLVISALRMRPDRIVVGECRGSEAWDMLIAMNTGHDGSMATLHSNSAFDALRRLEAMIIRSGLEAPLQMIQTDVASTVKFIIFMNRGSDGTRRVEEVVEVMGRDKDNYVTREIFKWTAAKGFRSTGNVPSFVQRPTSTEMQLNHEFFNPVYEYKAAG
ncbi:MAG: CpaF family protein [Bdellovibrionia bacterium]